MEGPPPPLSCGPALSQSEALRMAGVQMGALGGAAGLPCAQSWGLAGGGARASRQEGLPSFFKGGPHRSGAIKDDSNLVTF